MKDKKIEKEEKREDVYQSPCLRRVLKVKLGTSGISGCSCGCACACAGPACSCSACGNACGCTGCSTGCF